MTQPLDGAAGAFQRRAVQVAGADGVWSIAVEAPVEIRLNGVPWTVMLATPADLEDLAVGIAFTERRIVDPTAIEHITVSRWLGDITVDLVVDPAAVKADVRGRSLASNTSCGLCGLESLAAFRGRLDEDGRGSDPVRAVTDAAIARAWAALPGLQALNSATRSVHGAAWCSPEGDVLLVREDVGRHNALDKLIGARERSAALTDDGFIIMTSRCSYELVYKAASARALVLATISAPTTLALTWSESLGVPLAAAGPASQVVRFPLEVPHAIG